MDAKEYVKLATKTESCDWPKIKERTSNVFQLRTLHSAMGICTEAGELMDALKKFIFYGKDLDVVNVKEELGDLNWYIALMCDNLNISLEDIWETNIEKLAARYPDKFTEKDALNRNLNKERKILEGEDGTK